jgi:mono/diheme cytochrome c family protein
MRPVILAWLALIGTAAVAQEAPQGNAATGAALARQLCRGCHLISAEDRGPVPDGVPSFVAIANAPDQTARRIAARIMGDHPIMPQPPLTAQQAADVAAHIISLRAAGG